MLSGGSACGLHRPFQNFKLKMAASPHDLRRSSLIWSSHGHLAIGNRTQYMHTPTYQTMENIDIDGTPFSVLMDRAVKLKSSQTAHQSEKYNSFPSFYSGTIWPNEEATKARKLNAFLERLAAANLMKEEGNSAFRDGRLSDAMKKYEMALSVFRFLENTNPRWKSEGIKDQYIKEVEYTGKDDRECKELNRFLVNCYNNIALVSYKMKDFSLAVKACDHAIVVDGQNTKAFFIRAQARLTPKSSSAVDQALAKSDLQLALKHNTDNREAMKLLQKLSNQMKTQRLKDRCTFKGLFDRGEIYDAQELHEQKEERKKCTEVDKIDSKHRDIILGRQLVQLYEERGLEKEKQQLEQSLMAVTETRVSVNDLDFRNPSAKMIEDAKSMGVDLKDPQTAELLEKMKAGHSNGNLLAKDAARSGKRGNTFASSIEKQTVACGPKQQVYTTILSGIIIIGHIFMFFKQFRLESSYE